MSYKPNIIIHVYNDLADRGEEAEIFYKDKLGKKWPRLLWVVSKNKINSFKNRFVVDVDPTTVSAKPKNVEEAESEFLYKKQIPEESKKEMDSLESDLGFEIESEFEE